MTPAPAPTRRPRRTPTPRQVAIFLTACRLHSHKAAAAQFGLSTRTVDAHIRTLYQTLGVDCDLGALEVLGRLTYPEG